MWGGWVLQVDDSFKIENTYRSVTLSIKKKISSFVNELVLSSRSPLILLFVRNMPFHPTASCSPPLVSWGRGWAHHVRGLPLRHLVWYCTFVLSVEHNLESVTLTEHSYFKVLFLISLNLLSLTMPEKWDTILTVCRDLLSLFILVLFIPRGAFKLPVPCPYTSCPLAGVQLLRQVGIVTTSSWEMTHNHISLNTTLTYSVLVDMKITLLNCRFWFSRSVLRPKFCVSNQL